MGSVFKAVGAECYGTDRMKAKRLRFALFFLGIVGFAALALEGRAAPNDAFFQGVEHYKKGEYGEAARLFEKLLEESAVTSHVYFNLGNTYYRQGFKGRAIWAYEMARRRDARDDDILWNAEVLRKTLVDRAEGGLSVFDRITSRWNRWFSRDETALLLFFFAAMFAVASSVHALNARFRLLAKRLALIAVLALLPLGAVSAMLVDDMRHPKAVIQDREVYARYGPSEVDTKAFLLHEGTMVKIRRNVGDWYSIEFGRRQTGWIPRSSVLVL